MKFANLVKRVAALWIQRQSAAVPPYDLSVTDRKGAALKPGDYVSFKMYPRGSSIGWVVKSPRALTEWVDAEGKRHWVPALAIKTEDGTVFSLVSKGVLKQTKQIPPPAGLV